MSLRTRSLLLVADRDLRRRFRDPTGLLLWFAIPVAIALMMKFAFGGDEEMPKAKVAVADQDSSFVSGLVVAAFTRAQANPVMEGLVADSTEGRTLAREGKVSALVIIPRGFGDDVLAERTAHLTLYKNPAERVLPQIAEETVQILAEGSFYLRASFGEPIRQIVASTSDSLRGPADVQVSEISILINQAIQRVQRYVFPPVIALETQTKESEGLGADYFTLLFPGLLLVGLIFVSQSLAFDLWIENRLGTLRRNLAVSTDLGSLIGGKCLAGVIVLFVLYLAFLAIGPVIFSLTLVNVPALLLFGAVAAFAILAGVQLIALIPKTDNGATIFTSFIIMPLVLLGGSFFPVESYPPTLRAIAVHTPNGWMREQIKELVLGRFDATQYFVNVGICLLAGAVCVVLAGRLARRRFVGS